MRKAFRFYAGMALMLGLATPATAAPGYKLPQFSGRDSGYAPMKKRIIEGLEDGANFAGHYTVVTVGCGTGCSSNLLIDRRSGKIDKVPYGGEFMQLLSLRYGIRSTLMRATWMGDDVCFSQQARWTGSGFVILSAPEMVPTEMCNS